MTEGPTIRRGSSRQDYGTPKVFMDAIAHRFGKPEFDLAATAANAKAPQFFTPEMDSLKLQWATMTRGSLSFLNPPYSNISPWACKCANEAVLGAKILFLVPASIGANWFRDHVHNNAFVLALNGRITFEGETDPYPRDCLLAVYGAGLTGFDVWNWNKTP